MERPLSGMNAKIEMQIPSLRRYAWSLTGNRHDADDLVQDCIEKAIRGWGSLKNEDKLRQWLFSILHNQFLNDIRRRRNRQEEKHDPLDVDIPNLQTQADTVYLRQVLRAVMKLTPERRKRFMEPVAGGTDLRVRREVRSMVTFKSHNLMDPPPSGGPFDAIFCRNVMIYFDRPTREKLVNRLASVLRPGGILAVGSAETLSGIDAPLQPLAASVYVR